jgi:chromosome segregation protein
MYLKQLDMKGFKSFVDAQIVFQPGITAIVGPNGTGKSNILDAILWVLGEQSTKTMRSERMEDVIFNGTESRKPHGMVEVSMILGDVDGAHLAGAPARLPYALGDCQEVMVTRRLFRDGVSEYFINETPCRLKDLRGLLMDTRAGSKGHTVIEQGMIDRLLKSSPSERRELIEETAGIVRYKKQKAEALRKLEATNQNLLRVRDIVNEVKRQLGGLERQARAAKAYQALREELRRLELMVLIHEHQQVSSEARQCAQTLNELTDREAAEAAAEARLISELEKTRVAVTEGEAAITQRREQVTSLEARLSQAITSLELLGQRSAFLEEQHGRAQADLRQVQEERQEGEKTLFELRERVTALEQVHLMKADHVAGGEAAFNEAVQRYRSGQDALVASRKQVMERVLETTALTNQLANIRTRSIELRRRIERLAQERIQAAAALDAVCHEMSARLSKRGQTENRSMEVQAARTDLLEMMGHLRSELVEVERRTSALQEERSVSAARRETLEKINRHVSMPAQLDAPPLGPILAHVMTVPSEFDPAIEAFLGHKLMGTLVVSLSAALQLLKRLKTESQNGGTFIPARPRVFETQASAGIQGEGIIGSALELVTPRDGYEVLVKHLLTGVIIVRTLDDAIRIWGGMSGERQAVLVTLSGEVVTPDGIVSASPPGAAAGVMGRERELQTLKEREGDIARLLEDTTAHRDRLEQLLAEKTASMEAWDSELRRLEMDLVIDRKDEQRSEQDLEQSKQRIDLTSAELAAAEAEQAVLMTAEQKEGEALRHSEMEQALAEQTLKELEAATALNEQDVERRQAQATEARLEMVGLTERLEQSRAQVLTIEEAAAARRARIVELETELGRLEAARVSALTERGETEAGIPAIESSLADARGRLLETQERQVSRSSELRALEADSQRLRHGLDGLRREQEAVRLRHREAEVRLEGYEREFQGNYGVTFDGAVSETGGLNGQQDLQTVRETLAGKREKLQQLGPVNVMAIEEHRELEERLRFLTIQEEDLAQSVSSIKAIIAKINRTTKELFLDTFQALQAQFDEMFKKFFEGGRAELVLVEEEEGGEPGIDIVAQPPGKRLKNIAMLSGGERAKTAISLIFASFLIRPTPFCVLDEIDAPLDEENTVRFRRILEDMSARSQFIVITHSKLTMEVADSLYGVTMEDPGVSALVSVRLSKALQPA